MIEIRNVSKIYKTNKALETVALNNISFSLPSKGIVFLIGKSGSGKSTLLNILGCLDSCTTGDVIINNKSINDLKNSKLDSFRNKYIGFIFQDYNLIDNYNVHKNIELSLNLQKKNASKQEIEEILGMVGLYGLKYRNVNELSGGQKQRVAIARALIKKPNIILADEPTGNVDSETSSQIFTILKNISKEKLVIVVTHDLESANKYADRIIELADGIVVSDKTINECPYTAEPFSLVKSKLSFIKSLSFAFLNFWKKKLRFVLTTILVAIALAVFGFGMTLTKFNTNRTHAETMIKEEEYSVEIYKKIVGENFTLESPVITFTENEVEEAIQKINKPVVKVYKVVENNSYLQIHESGNVLNNEEHYAYYDLSSSDLQFLEYNDELLNNLNIIGFKPSNNNEVLIHKVLADYIIKNGILVWGVDEKNNLIEKNFNPKTYEEIINSKEKIILGSSYIIISGILDEKLTKYDELKTILSDEMAISPTQLYKDFLKTYEKHTYQVIVNSNFFDSIELIPNNVLSIDFYKPVIIYNNKIYSNTQMIILDKEIEIYDGQTLRKIKQLNAKEMIINPTILDELYNNEYSTKLLEYIDQKKSDYENDLREYERKIKEQEEKIINDPNYIYEEIKSIDELDTEKIIHDFTINYVKNKKVIGETLSLEINDMFLRTQEVKTNLIENIKIIGIDITGIDTYLSETDLSKYMRDNNEVLYLHFEETSASNLEKIFKTFPSENSNFISKTIFTEDIKNVEAIVNKIEVIFMYCSIGFFLFAIILFSNFIIVSINNCKKEIGILRGLGARKIDIYKIFYLESFLIGIFSFIISSILCYIGVIFSNNLISKNLFLSIEPIIFNSNVVVYIFITVMIISFIASIIPTYKISKMKPVEAIYK